MRSIIAAMALSAGVISAQNSVPPAQTETAPGETAPTIQRKAATAKTQDEFDAYQRVVTQPNLALAENLAQDFAVRYPASELRAPLFQSLMLKHQQANETELTMRDAERVLLLDPDNVIALVTAANVLSERTLPDKSDSAQRFDQAIRFAQRAIDNIETGLTVPPQVLPADADRFRNTILAIAYAAQGNVNLLQRDFADAEKHLGAAAELFPVPNALVLYRLAVAQHQQKRYDVALENANKSLEAANQSHDLIVMDRAKQEKNALVKALARPK
jgi:tetratricopeptide (TPR) repeat protein